MKTCWPEDTSEQLFIILFHETPVGQFLKFLLILSAALPNYKSRDEAVLQNYVVNQKTFWRFQT